MKTSLTSYREQFREALLGFLWRQWSAIGVSGQAQTMDIGLVDPEALLLFSTSVARHDARLFDEILDWLQLNGDCINLQRLSRLQKEHCIGDDSILAALAAHISRGGAHTKWRTVVQRAGKRTGDAIVYPLFPHLTLMDRTEEAWLAWGWQRPPGRAAWVSARLRTQTSPPPFYSSCVRFWAGRHALKSWLGLLDHEAGHPAEIARATGYFRGSVQSVLNELASSGHVFAVRVGREKQFGLKRDEWRFLLTWSKEPTTAFPRWLPWPAIFGLLRRVDDLLSKPELDRLSALAQAIELNRAIAPALATITPAGFWQTPPAGLTGESSLQATTASLQVLMGRISVGGGAGWQNAG